MASNGIAITLIALLARPVSEPPAWDKTPQPAGTIVAATRRAKSPIHGRHVAANREGTLVAGVSADGAVSIIDVRDLSRRSFGKLPGASVDGKLRTNGEKDGEQVPDWRLVVDTQLCFLSDNEVLTGDPRGK
ncbi:MAG TPA: hypothetical protein VNC50_07830, partial [Planctomycetia bacterium]|nr:hypothetical protein [Planctomycetia bacterium]